MVNKWAVILKPLSASATSPTFELDIVEPSQGLNLNESWFLLDRLMIIIDLTLNVNQNQYPNVISISGFSGSVVFFRHQPLDFFVLQYLAHAWKFFPLCVTSCMCH